MKKLLRSLSGLFAIVGLCAAPLFASQPLPQGKTNFSICVGNFDTVGATWVRMGNWTFDGNAGTIAATYWQWDSAAKQGKYPFNAHTCTQDGVTDTCTVYTPKGWGGHPAGLWFGWSGTYTYNTSTGALHIVWSNGCTEDWTVTLPASTIAKVSYVYGSSTGTGYTVTHGRGYGSNASWSTYKTIGNIPRIQWTGQRAGVHYDGSTYTFDSPTPGGWAGDGFNNSSFTSSVTGNTFHLWTSTASCTGPCGTSGRTGIVYHYASDNSSRSFAYNHWCACLPSAGEWPCYNSGMHPYAMQQIIDDNGAMRAIIGAQQQDEVGGTSYTYSLKDWDDGTI